MCCLVHDLIRELMQIADSESCEGRQREGLSRIIQFFQDAVSAPEKCKVPVIAAITGNCIGGAIDLVTACDLRYSTDDALFSVKETDLGIVADLGTLQRLPKLIGEQRTRELVYTSRAFNGKEAKAMGLVLDSFPTKDELDAHVLAIAKSISEKSPLAVRGSKRVLLYSRDHSVDESLQQVKLWNSAHVLSDDLKESVAAAMSKRTPNYRN